MERQILLFLLLFLSAISVWAQEKDEKQPFFILHGQVKNGNSKKIYLSYTSSDKDVRDSVIVINNQFVFKRHISCPTGVYIKNESAFKEASTLNSAFIFLEPKEMIVDLDYSDFRTLKLEGSKTQTEFEDLRKIREKYSQKYDSLSKSYRSRYEKIEASGGGEEQIRKMQNEIWPHIQKNSEQLTQTDLNFAREHLSSFVSLDILKTTLPAKDLFPVVDDIFNKLDRRIQQSEDGKLLRFEIKKIKVKKKPIAAANFSGKDVNGNPISLNDFKNKKYILLDFWASWCKPCRMDLPELKIIYEKYHDKGFEIISISKDENFEMWHQTITTEGIGKWKHFSVKENNSVILQDYAVTAIPLKILIDKDGKIIERWTGYSEDGESELKKILERIFRSSN